MPARPRPRPTWALATVLGCAVGCGPSPVAPRGLSPPARTDPAREASASPEIDPARSSWVRLGPPATVRLPTAVEPITGSRDVLFVSQPADEAIAYARRRDAETGALDPVLTLVGERVIAAFAGDEDRFTLVTSRVGPLTHTSREVSVCAGWVHHGTGALEERGCVSARPTAIASVNDRLALLSAGPPIADERTPTPGKRPPRADKKSAKGPGASGGDPEPQEIALSWMSRDGALVDSEPIGTGLTFGRAFPGMHLIEAAGRAGGIDVLFYEAADDDDVRAVIKRREAKRKGKPDKNKKPSLGFARIGAASLDADGHLVERSRVEVVNGELFYGFLMEHHEPRLLSGPHGSVYVARQWPGGPCEARRVSPTLGPTGVDEVVCAADPLRFSILTPVDEDERADYAGLVALEPSRTYAQPPRDPARVRWVGERALFLARGDVVSADPDGGRRRVEPHPFDSHRARVAWASVDVDGAAIAIVDGAPVAVAPGGTAPPTPQGAKLFDWATRGDVAPAGRVARIGEQWWVAAGDLVELGGAHHALAGRGAEGTTALAGGDDAGWLVEWHPGQLEASSVGRDGVLTRVGGVRVRLAPSILATRRRGGGALVAGVSRESGAIVTFALRPDGTSTAPVTTLSAPAPDAPADLEGATITPLPQGGAIFVSPSATQLAWLDDDGKPLATADWRFASADAACVDGRPGRSPVPSPVPGRFMDVPELVQPGVCVVSTPVWGRDGALRFVGARQRGADSEAYWAEVRVGAEVPASSNNPAPAPDAGGALPSPPAASGCPPTMVRVLDFCIDRFEGQLVDEQARVLSPDYPSTPKLRTITFERWATQREVTGDVHARATWLPFLEPWQIDADPKPRALSRRGVIPNGYVTGHVAKAACANAGKRLCKLAELRTACRGEADLPYPYGPTYEEGACNVFRREHPAALLHDHPSIGHLDPRLNRVVASDGPMLRRTGDTPRCVSRWGDDGVYDLVGNLDEWVDEKGGAFAGGFYSRSTRSGCDAVIENHPVGYLDYSTGVRCCADASTGAPR